MLTTSKIWYVKNMCSITTLERQFKALKNFDRISDYLKEILLRPDLHVKEAEKKFKIPIKLDEKLKQNYN